MTDFSVLFVTSGQDVELPVHRQLTGTNSIAVVAHSFC